MLGRDNLVWEDNKVRSVLRCEASMCFPRKNGQQIVAWAVRLSCVSALVCRVAGSVAVGSRLS